LPLDSKELIFPRIAYDSDKKSIFLNLIKTPDELKNIDGTGANDFNTYKIYYKKFSGLDTNAEIKEKLDLLQDSLLSGLEFLKSFPYSPEPVEISIGNTNPKGGETYFFIVVAYDKNQNPEKSRFKLNEIGAEPLRYTLP